MVRHAAPVDGASLEALAAAAMAEAERYGVKARLRFSFDPALTPSTG